MSTSNYQDSTSFVGGNGKADDYTMLQNYSLSGNSQSAPLQSVLKLSLPKGGDKYFSVNPNFQSRLDNFRIAPPVMTPVGLTDNGVAMQDNATMRSVEGGNFASSGEYSRLGQSYKLSSR